MLNKIFISLLLFCGCTVSAQLTISSGAQFTLQGNAQLTLQNMDLINNGSFTAGNGVVSFTGNANSNLNGSGTLQFYSIEINKSSGNKMVLQKAITVSQNINFTSGLIDLNGFDIDLSTTGSLMGESENSRVIGANGGRLLFATTLNNPLAANPANLGAIITTSQNLGNVIIARGHSSQSNGFGNGNSILRFYDIIPTSNTGLNATLRLSYFDAELNGLNENNLVQWKSTDNIHWSNQGFTTRNTATDFVEKTAINDFSRWTLSTAGNVLPVQLVFFNSKCLGNQTLLQWRTAQEQNSSHFTIERSSDAQSWNAIATINAAGNSNVIKDYSFTDNNPSQSNFYRVAQYDIGGAVHYSGILRSSCSAKDLFSLYPNPTQSLLYVSVNLTQNSTLSLQMYDSKGALVKQQSENLLQGNNQLILDVKNFAAGTYSLLIKQNGEVKATIPFVKQ